MRNSGPDPVRLSGFDWTVRNLIAVRQGGVAHLERNLSLEGVVTFLKSHTGRFRVETKPARRPTLAICSAFLRPGAAAWSCRRPMLRSWRIGIC